MVLVRPVTVRQCFGMSQPNSHHTCGWPTAVQPCMWACTRRYCVIPQFDKCMWAVHDKSFAFANRNMSMSRGGRKLFRDRVGKTNQYFSALTSTRQASKRSHRLPTRPISFSVWEDDALLYRSQASLKGDTCLKSATNHHQHNVSSLSSFAEDILIRALSCGTGLRGVRDLGRE